MFSRPILLATTILYADNACTSGVTCEIGATLLLDIFLNAFSGGLGLDSLIAANATRNLVGEKFEPWMLEGALHAFREPTMYSKSTFVFEKLAMY